MVVVFIFITCLQFVQRRSWNIFASVFNSLMSFRIFCVLWLWGAEGPVLRCGRGIRACQERGHNFVFELVSCDVCGFRGVAGRA